MSLIKKDIEKKPENNREKVETHGIRVMLILEVIGKPPKHLVETLENITKAIDEEKGVVVNSKKINEPVEMENQNKGFYTSFAEVEVEVEEIANLAILLFKYMPAHVDVIEPELIALTNNGWSDIINEITRRLHGYDEVARILSVEKNMLQKKLEEALGKKSKKKKSSKAKKKR